MISRDLCKQGSQVQGSHSCNLILCCNWILILKSIWAFCWPLEILRHNIHYSVHNIAVSEVMRCWWLCCIRCWGCGVMNTIENHLLHLNQGPGANGDSRRRPRGKRGSPISPGRSSTDNARILWQFHEKITPRSGACRRLQSPIAPGCFHGNHSDSSHRCS